MLLACSSSAAAAEFVSMSPLSYSWQITLVYQRCVKCSPSHDDVFVRVLADLPLHSNSLPIPCNADETKSVGISLDDESTAVYSKKPKSQSPCHSTACSGPESLVKDCVRMTMTILTAYSQSFVDGCVHWLPMPDCSIRY